MPEVPSCLNRRYRALDNLIRELDSSSLNTIEPPSDSSNVGIRLMCDFWNILKDDPDCNLTQEVQQCLGINSPTSESFGNTFGMQRYLTYRECCEDKKDKNKGRRIQTYKDGRYQESPQTPNSSPMGGICCPPDVPLSKVLCNLKEAASFDQKCHVRVKELMKAQEELTKQIQALEQRESAGVELLKQADEMWMCMEEAYKNKVAESLDRQKDLLKELKDVEGSCNKWRKNERDLEFQIKNMVKVKMDIIENKNQKLNDIKVMDTEIENFEKRIDSNYKDIDNTKKTFAYKRQNSNARIASIAAEVSKVQQRTQQEIARKREREEEGAKYVKDARDDLQKICKVLLQKKIEHEDLRAERTAILEELELLNQTADNCKERCKNKENNLKQEIKTLTTEIAAYKVKCTKCHVFTDTSDVRNMCTDCPKCLEDRECLYGDTSCAVDPTWDCVCMSVKQKFLDNIFDNMYTVLERKSKTPPGKAVADAVLNCLKISTNGKLNAETRRILQDFVLTTVRKSLNLTIVGGAVKTRCEMDPETYKQLMLCLNRVPVPKATKADKGTTKKEPCPRWTKSMECHCPKGPQNCICGKKAPPQPNDPAPCPPQDPEDAGETTICPHKGGVCGPECGMQGKPLPGMDPTEIASWRPDPCSGPSCSYSKETKPTQFLLGPETRTPESLEEPIKKTPEHVASKAPSKTSRMASPVRPSSRASPSSRVSSKHSPTRPSNRASARHSPIKDPDNFMDFMASCMCTGSERKPCPCLRDRKRLPRDQIIEEVMGRYNDIPPISKVARTRIRKERASNTSRQLSRCNCNDYSEQYFKPKKNRYCGCSSGCSPVFCRTSFFAKSRRKRNRNICRCCNYNNMVRCGNITLFTGCNSSAIYKNKTSKQIINNDIKGILYPKFVKRIDSDVEASFDSSNNLLGSSSYVRIMSGISQSTNPDIKSNNANHFDKSVCDTVKELIKDIIIDPEEVKQNELSSDVEWITVEKLFGQVTSFTNLDDCSNVTVNEMEMICETLELSQR